MNYLQVNNKALRIAHQLEGVMLTLPLDFAAEKTGFPAFNLAKESLLLQDLSDLEIENNLRLGNRVECFFKYLLGKMKDYDLILQGTQIIENKITLGELDFIVFDKQNKVFEHIEIAGKFYLYDDSFLEEEKRWIGPNRTDSLFDKCEKLKNKQFALLQNEITQKLFSNIDIDVTKIRQSLYFIAQLFVPLRLKDASFPLVKPENIKGYYVNLEEFQDEKFKTCQYFVPEKQDWFSEPKHCEIWFSYQDIQNSISLHFSEYKSPLLWVKTSENRFEIIFVVWW